MVNAISGVRFAVIFLGAFLLTRLKPSWLKEDFHGWQLATKTFATCLVVSGLAVVSLSGSAKGTGSSPAAMQASGRQPHFQVITTDSDPPRPFLRRLVRPEVSLDKTRLRYFR